MEETNVLLSKLVQTKAVERVLARIANQVSQLIILNEAYERGEQDAFPPDLVPRATNVMRSTEEFVSTALKFAIESEDEDLKVQMPAACETLSIAGSNFVTATQRAEVDDYDHLARRNLIRAAKDILEATLKVFMLSDDAEVRKVVRSSYKVREKMAPLTSVTTMSQLVPVFKEFTEAVLQLANQANRRQLELTHPQQRDRILVTMSTLKKSIHMLKTAMQTFVRYPSNPQAKSSKEYALGQVLECLDDIIDAVENKSLALDDSDEADEPGSFVSDIDKLLDLLSEESRLESVRPTSDLDFVVDSAIHHAMSVAHMSLEKHRNLIIKNCQRILAQQRTVQEQGRNLLDNPSFQELSADFEEACERHVEEFQDLERHVNAAILQLTVDTFTETTQPLDRLVKAALKPLLEAEPIQESVCQTMLEPYIQALNAHSDKIGQVARFVAASSADSRRVCTIRSCIQQLDRLDPELVPATITCRQDISNQGALQHLRLLKHEWTSNVKVLVSTIDDMTDAATFVHVAALELQNQASHCKMSLNFETPEMAEASRTMIGGARRFAAMATRLVNTSEDPVYRNGVMVYLTQLNKIVAALKSAANRIVNDPSNVSLHQALHKRCDLLLKVINKVGDALEGSSHPNLFDPLRSNVRPLLGLRSLEGEVDGQSDIEDEETSRHISTLNKHSSSVVKPAIKQQTAMKSYIADLVSSHLKDLMCNLTTAAIAGNQKNVDLNGNIMLVITNHVTELARTIAGYNTEHREALQQVVLEVTKLTPQLLDKSRKVVELDTNQVEPLHQVAETWANKVTYLEGMIDGIVDKWKAVSDKVVEAAKVANIKLLQAQSHHLDEHRQIIHGLVSAASGCLNNTDMIAMETAHILTDNLDDLDNQTVVLVNKADAASKSESDEEKRQLQHAGREWAVKVYVIMAAIQTTGGKVISSVMGHQVTIDTQDHSQSQGLLRKLTEETIRWKILMRNASEGSLYESKIQEGNLLLDDLDILIGEMNECCGGAQASAPYQSMDKLYAPHRLTVLLWQWVVKVLKTGELIDGLTVDFSLTLEGLTSPHIDSSSSLQTANEISNNFQQVKAKVLDIIQDADNLELKAKVRERLDDLGKLTQEMTDLVKNSRGREGDREIVWCRRQWACKAQTLTHTLHNLTLPTTKQNALTDALLQLKNKPRNSYISSSPDVSTNIPSLRTAPEGGSSKASLLSVVSTPKGNDKTDGNQKKINQEPTLKQLMKGPKTIHTKPEPPSENSGWKPNKLHRAQSRAALALKHEADQWEDDNNAIVKVAKEMTQHLCDMTLFTKADEQNPPTGSIKTKEGLINTAKDIAKNGEKLVKFAKVLAQYSVDKRFGEDLLFYAEHVPSVATQLNILASVKAATPDDSTAEKMLIRNAENLMEAITKMLRAAEATCVKGLRDVPAEAVGDAEALVLASQWRRKLTLYRELETSKASVDELGLRRVSHNVAPPALTQIVARK